MKKEIASPIVFFGSEEGSVSVLKKLLPLEYLNIVTVITQPPRPAGRNRQLTPTPVGQFAQDHNLPLIIPEKINQSTIKAIKQLKPTLAILAAYGKIIPQELIDLFPEGIINVHPSLLPKFRGPTPAVQAILSGNKKTGVSLFIIDRLIDHGPIIAQKEVIINSNDTQESLTRKLFLVGADLIVSKLPDYLNRKITPQEQNHSQATFTKLLSRQDGQIELPLLKKALEGNGSATRKLDQKIRAFFPWPGTYIETNDQRLKILQAHQDGRYLKLDLVQLAGKNPVPWDQNLAKIILS